MIHDNNVPNRPHHDMTSVYIMPSAIFTDLKETGLLHPEVFPRFCRSKVLIVDSGNSEVCQGEGAPCRGILSQQVPGGFR